jgi:hypothetical protein
MYAPEFQALAMASGFMWNQNNGKVLIIGQGLAGTLIGYGLA